MEDPEAVIHLVGRRIAELRKRAGMTQEDMAERLGVSSRYLSRAEYQGENLTLDSLVKIANLLGVRTRELLDDPSPAATKVKTGRPRKTP